MEFWRRSNSFQLSLLFFFVSFYFFTNAGWYQSGDEIAIVKVAKKIVSTGHIGLELDETAREPEDDLVRGRSGYYYYKFGLGQSLVEVPFLFLHQLFFQPLLFMSGSDITLGDYSMSELLFLLLCPSLISAVGCVLICRFAQLLSFSKKISFGLALIYGLGTMAWPYSKSLMSETTLNVVILGGVYAAVSYKLTAIRRWLILSGTLMGFAFITKSISAVVFPMLVAYLLFSPPARRVLPDLVLCFGMPVMVFIGIQGWHNFIRYDSFFEFGYGFGWDHLGFSTPLSVGLWGLLLSPGKSLFLYSPVILLCLFSFKRFLHTRRSEAFLFLGITLAFVLPHASWWAWSGDRAWGPRFLLPIIPYFVVPLGCFIESWSQRSNLYRRLCISLAAFSIGIQILGVAIDPQQFPRYRQRMLGELADSHGMSPRLLFLDLSYVHFNPELSHIFGNYWLSKHMLFPYDLWSDPPWTMIGKFGLTNSRVAEEEKVVPFWWPAAFPLIASPSWKWVFPLAGFSLVMAVFWGLRIWRTNSEGGGSRI
jgi:hypothetical protein